MKEDKKFGDFLTEKRLAKGITSIKMSEIAGISPGYYCDIERNRRNPPDDREVLDKIISALHLSDEDETIFFDLAGKARSEVALDLPEYIMENDYVRTALRLAKDKADPDDWQQFIEKLRNK